MKKSIKMMSSLCIQSDGWLYASVSTQSLSHTTDVQNVTNTVLLKETSRIFDKNRNPDSKIL